MWCMSVLIGDEADRVRRSAGRRKTGVPVLNASVLRNVCYARCANASLGIEPLARPLVADSQKNDPVMQPRRPLLPELDGLRRQYEARPVLR